MSLAGNFKIAVVDDDPDIVETVCALLQEEALEPVACPHGASAYSCIRETHPRAIVLDVQMPGINGVAVYHALQHDPLTHDIPVVFLTGDVSRLRKLLPKSDERGIAILEKPFDVNELITVLHAALAAPRH